MSDEMIVLGQAIKSYSTPQNIIDEVNKIYDNREKEELPPTNKFLAGKIKSEHTLYHNEMNDASKNFNLLSTHTLDWFQNKFQH